MADDKKSKSAMSMFGGDDDAPPDAPADAGGDPFDEACDEVLVAIKAGDKAGFCSALKAAIHLVTSEGDAEEETPPEAA